MQRRSWKTTLPLAGLAVLACLLWSVDAEANCARPIVYAPHVDGNRVVVCPHNFSGRGCQNDDVLLRENVETGQVARIPTCVDSGEDSEFSDDCFVDRCVEAGTYRYGFAEPYSCNKSACSTDYFGEAEVEATGESCEADKTTAVSYDGDVPWDDERTICSYGPPDVTGLVGCAHSNSPERPPRTPLAALVLLGLGLLGARRLQ